MTETHGLSIKRIAGYTATVVATLAMLLVLYRLGQVVLLFVLSITVAAALRKGVIALENRRVPRGVAILFWYLVVIGTLGLGIYFLGATLRNELQVISDELPRRYDALITGYQQRGAPWQRSIAERLPKTDAVIESVGSGGAAEIGFQIAGLTSSLLNVGISAVAILTLTFYWLVDQDRLERLWLTLLPVQQRAIARHTWRGVEYRVGAYVRSEATQFVLTITVLWGALTAIGVPYPTLYAIYAGVVQLIPWVGLPLTLLPLPLLLLTLPPTPLWLIGAAAAIIIVVGVVMDRVIEPRLRGDAVVHPILTVLALMVMGEVAGVIGMVIALPIAATAQILLNELVRMNTAPQSITTSIETTQLKELRQHVDRLREELPEDEDYRREAEGMLARLRDLVDKTDEVVREHGTAQPEQNGAPRRRILLGRARPSSR
jgi:predicted PurR-regulated permease PerM